MGKLPPLRTVFASNEILWALIGLLLTIAGTLIEAFTTNFPWNWAEQGVRIQSLSVTYQIGAVLFVGCLGGKRAGALSQIAYLVLGLTWLPVFSQGGGWDYFQEPTFGYLVGFVPGAWLCGFFAFKTQGRLESLAFSCLCGLLTIHLFGMGYLTVLSFLPLSNNGVMSLLPAIQQYSLSPLPGQLAIVCAVAVLALGLRQLMFY
ncbi:MAG: biotin transporter BioY [Cyanobacteria bacterium QS_7_48_42]|jgi:biotin transport system substrate-specific component|nr:MAG: biotin transporter BioY [Cyanobacteria bacterium QH_1_48_107]PSO59228.1 MAG: biotin transporter BioY [Cyanobacteria bacterium QH_2_48_84]PSO60540.1 MAG: biotin transporter BioY [Cyanobacteria bacterium QH_10_48_56]PSO61843.1 MAG: biotin transporter BioY [Cyanobacteria bacterium QH_7_48_89]PSO63302.1 MAG: biotin transporter BioY [Cyanobacteria bacterium QH_6_48_35]PSO71191.1 MAG: biotin transporter BioY [Cyanobacteria bacterium QS_1_48_34]PSO72519.1 MAG: biotin transporter BioY [Cyanob